MSTRHDQLAQQFQKFHGEHPEVFARFKSLAFDRIGAGFKHYGAQDLLGMIRWHTGLGADGITALKINDHFAPFYSRLFAEKHPEHAAFFRRRKQISKRRPPSRKGPPKPSDFKEEP